MCTKDFIRKVLSGEKKMMKRELVKFIVVPNYDELSVKNLFPLFRKNAQLMLYLPDEYPENRGPDRTYFFNILNTLDSDYTGKMVAHANQLRFGSGNADQANDEVIVNEEMWTALNHLPFHSGKLIQV